MSGAGPAGPEVRAAAVIAAGGAGLRMGGRRKQYELLGGEPLLLRALAPFLRHPAVRWVIVALPPEDVAHPPVPLPPGVRVVAGGEDRTGSVRNALEAVPVEADVVLIHDAARPLVPDDVVDRTLRAAAGGAGAVAAIPVADTLKRVEAGRVTATVERRGLWRAQTPQAFPRALILDAHRRAAREGVSATDDAALVERYGGRVVVVEGSIRSLKVTTAADLRLAELLLAASEVAPPRAPTPRG